MKPFTILLLWSSALCLGAQEPAMLKLTKTIALPGVKGRFDHFAIDVKGHRLFVAALGNNTLEVIDTAEGKLLKTISGPHKPTGVLYLAGQNQIAVANGDDGTLKVFGGDSYALVKTVGSLDDADNLRFDAKTKQIYLGYGDGALAVIDSATMQQTGNIKLAAHPESFQLETQGSRIFVNLPDAKQIAIIDRDKQTVTATLSMEKFHANFPMALDEASGRLFVGCRQPAWLVVFDTSTGKPVTDLALSGDIDDLFYDTRLKRLYASCGEGFIDVIAERSPDKYDLRERIPTRTGARTAFFSSDLNEFYLAVPQRGNQPAELRVFAVHD
ncbi:MAG TPA: YncE family protein [Verrucomicrobiae bacterium]|nr:YncE family protein [Verrucomicrobiae bacterium]